MIWNGGCLAGRAGLLMLPVLLAGCANTDTGYGPIGGEEKRVFGYEDTELGPGSYKVKLVYPAMPDRIDTLNEYWSQRAEELCGGTDYRSNIFSAVQPTQLYDYHGGRPSGTYVLEGFITCTGDSTAEADAQGGGQPADDTAVTAGD